MVADKKERERKREDNSRARTRHLSCVLSLKSFACFRRNSRWKFVYRPRRDSI